MRVTKVFKVDNPSEIKSKLLFWAQQFREICLFDSNHHQTSYSSFEMMLGVDAFTSIQTDAFSAFETLNEYQQTTKDYIFGFLSYDLKNGLEKLSSKNNDEVAFPEIYFFQPKKIIKQNQNEFIFEYLSFVDDEIDSDWNEILETTLFTENLPQINFEARTPKNQYLQKLNQVLAHIQRGDIYEANFCMEFFANATINPVQAFLKLNQISRPPFASFFKVNQHFALSASPERYLKKEFESLITQPIKGTAKRSVNAAEDEKLKFDLEQNPKERAENIMIVDLVRNDLSKIAQKGSVVVPELCKIYTFDQVHQMISTVTAKMHDEFSAVDAIKVTFPMGSMTGAPKISAMQICENLEDFKRGLYSGAIGYFLPNGDFDFNVVIRTILYNSNKKYISYGVGGAITAQSDPESEYNECLVKTKALFSIFNSNVNP